MDAKLKTEEGLPLDLDFKIEENVVSLDLSVRDDQFLQTANLAARIFPASLSGQPEFGSYLTAMLNAPATRTTEQAGQAELNAVQELAELWTDELEVKNDMYLAGDDTISRPVVRGIENDGYLWKDVDVIAGINGQSAATFKIQSLDGAINYTIEFSEDDFATIATTPPATIFANDPNQSTQSVQFNGLADNKRYSYRVKASRLAGDTFYSNTRSFRTIDSAARAGIIARYNGSAVTADRLNAANSYFNGNGYALNWQVRRGIISETVRVLRVLQDTSESVYEGLSMLQILAAHSITPSAASIPGLSGLTQDRTYQVFDWRDMVRLGEVIEQRFNFYYLSGATPPPPAVFNPDLGLRQNGILIRVDNPPADPNETSQQDGTALKTNYDHAADSDVSPNNFSHGYIGARNPNSLAPTFKSGFFVDGAVGIRGGVYHTSSLSGITMDKAFEKEDNLNVVNGDNQCTYMTRGSATTAKAFYAALVSESLQSKSYSFAAVGGETKAVGIIWFGAQQRGGDGRIEGISDRTLEVVFAGRNFTEQEINHFHNTMNWYLTQIKRRD